MTRDTQEPALPSVITAHAVRYLAFFSILVAVSCAPAAVETYDVVLSGGRVMDQESGFDGVRNVGIRDGRIEVIAEDDFPDAMTMLLFVSPMCAPEQPPLTQIELVAGYYAACLGVRTHPTS